MDRHMHARYLNSIVITVSASQILKCLRKNKKNMAFSDSKVMWFLQLSTINVLSKNTKNTIFF